jgi:hypothetical protein
VISEGLRAVIGRNCYSHLGETDCFDLQCKYLKIEISSSPETSQNFYETTRRNNLEENLLPSSAGIDTGSHTMTTVNITQGVWS